MHIFTKVVNSISIGRATSHGQRSRNFPAPTLLIFLPVLRRVIAPGVLPALLATASGAFPLRLRGQAIVAAGQIREPLAIHLRFHPTDGDHGVVRIIKASLIPIGWRRMPCGYHECGKVPIADLVDGHFEGVHPNAVDGTLIIAKLLTAHQEVSGGNQHTGGLNVVG